MWKFSSTLDETVLRNIDNPETTKTSYKNHSIGVLHKQFWSEMIFLTFVYLFHASKILISYSQIASMESCSF